MEPTSPDTVPIARFSPAMSAARAGDDPPRVPRIELGFARLDRGALGPLTLGDLTIQLAALRLPDMANLAQYWKMLSGWMDPNRAVADVDIPRLERTLTQGPATLSPATRRSLVMGAFALALEEGLGYCTAVASCPGDPVLASVDFLVPVWQASDGTAPDTTIVGATIAGGLLGRAGLAGGAKLGNRLARSSGQSGGPDSLAARFPGIGPARAYVTEHHLVLVSRLDPTCPPVRLTRAELATVQIRPRRQQLHRVRLTFIDGSTADVFSRSRDHAELLVASLYAPR